MREQYRTVQCMAAIAGLALANRNAGTHDRISSPCSALTTEAFADTFSPIPGIYLNSEGDQFLSVWHTITGSAHAKSIEMSLDVAIRFTECLTRPKSSQKRIWHPHHWYSTRSIGFSQLSLLQRIQQIHIFPFNKPILLFAHCKKSIQVISS